MSSFDKLLNPKLVGIASILLIIYGLVLIDTETKKIIFDKLFDPELAPAVFVKTVVR
uniref:Uncharacterized protein n=1 Tax=Candidatus Kentrum sp. LPFa TaxID=2126335 RepID=A0A450WRH4_9GAMM|nr:MAG: hypothetical protein BECKLPF1236B_GA0070989_11802 [Candidatus Kentron sp. LPFa]